MDFILMARIRITHIITGLSIGGAEAMLLKLLEKMDRNSFAPNVVSLTSDGDLSARIEALGIPVRALGMRPGKIDLIKFMELVKFLRKLQPDIVQTWMYHSDFLGGLAAKVAKVHAIAWAIRHSDLSPEHNKRSTLWVVKLCAALSSLVPHRILCCSDVASSNHIRFGYNSEKMITIPNGFDLDHFRPDPNARLSVRNELGLAQNTPLVGLIARYSEQKNHIGFIHAVAKINQHRTDTHFILAGAGIDQTNEILLRAAEEARVIGVIHLLGRRDDVPRIMAALDILASSSHGEAFPNVLGEAMACGIPCVVTDVGDSAVIVADTGRVVKAGNMDMLGESLLELLALSESERLELGSRARLRIMRNFEIGNIVKRYEDFYYNLVKEQR